MPFPCLLPFSSYQLNRQPAFSSLSLGSGGFLGLLFKIGGSRFIPSTQWSLLKFGDHATPARVYFSTKHISSNPLLTEPTFHRNFILSNPILLNLHFTELSFYRTLILPNPHFIETSFHRIFSLPNPYSIKPSYYRTLISNVLQFYRTLISTYSHFVECQILPDLNPDMNLNRRIVLPNRCYSTLVPTPISISSKS